METERVGRALSAREIFDLIQDDYVRMWNHDQIGRTEDFYLGTSVSARAGYAAASVRREPQRKSARWKWRT